MKKMLDHATFKVVGHIANLIGVFGFITTILTWMNWIPGYEFKRILSNTVQPQVYLFPAQKIRLSPAFVDGTQNYQVQWAKWTLKKYNEVAYHADGLEPTFPIPPSDGGIYQLEVQLQLSDEKVVRKGRTNIYVAQDNSEKIKTARKTTINRETSGWSDKLLKAAQVNGLEVYDGSHEWKAIDKVQINPSSITIPEDTELASFKGQAIIRTRGAGKNLLNYGTIIVPSEDNFSGKKR